MRILVIEDEKKTADTLRKGLEQSGFPTDVCYNAKDAIEKVQKSAYSLIISDILMPGISGLECCQKIREKDKQVPILLLTALNSKTNVLNGFDAGADDYLTKPFDFRELLARVKALHKRVANTTNDTELLQFADITLNVKSREVMRGGIKIDLSAKEFKLLEYFLRSPETLFSRGQLARDIWNIDFHTGTNIVEVYINYLRSKIDKPFNKRLIHNMHGMGYIMKCE